jgi:tRNA(Ile)-lysidine synthase
MALTYALSEIAKSDYPDLEIHALTVDHALRPESGEEAAKISLWIKLWPRVHHSILRWNHDPIDTRILEKARAARYTLIQTWMMEMGIPSLFLGHHRNDQAETFLFRLAKGSGLDGLSGMQKIQEKMAMNDGDDSFPVLWVRPFLDFEKSEILDFCKEMNIPFAQDPTNENINYARPRLRAAQDILEEEGLSAKRLARTAERLARARSALEVLSNQSYHHAKKDQTHDYISFDAITLRKAPLELMLRVLQKGLKTLNAQAGYDPSLERLEQITQDLQTAPHSTRATLAGCILAYDSKRGLIVLEKENR